jgi:hypothetical protein
LALDAAARPQVVYTDYTNHQIKYATSANGVDWQIEVIDATLQGTDRCDMAIDASGIAHVSYFDFQTMALRHASGTPLPEPRPLKEYVKVDVPRLRETAVLELRCAESVAGVCIRQEVARFCIGRNCYQVGGNSWPPGCLRCGQP